jgi:methylglutaconyl-CoA hydratase
MDEAYVKSETHRGITTIEFFHPKSNCLPGALIEELEKKIYRAGTNEGTRVIILKSAGETSFCGGASFDELADIKKESEALAFFSRFANLINTMRKCPKLIIGRIQGKIVGGGVGLTAATDYAIALKTAERKLSELSIAIGPFVIGPVVQRKIGVAAFSALTIDSTMWRSSEWGKKKSLFAEVHETAENMDESIFRLANHLSQSNPAAMSEIKNMLWQGTEHWDELLKKQAVISGRLVLSEFTRNAIEQFKVKALKDPKIL